MQTSETSDDEILLEEIRDKQFLLLSAIFTAESSTGAFFEDEKWQTEERILVDPDEGVRDQLACIQKLPHLFKLMTNFRPDEFEELCGIVSPVLTATARSSRGDPGRDPGRPAADRNPTPRRARDPHRR